MGAFGFESLCEFSKMKNAKTLAAMADKFKITAEQKVRSLGT